MYYQKKSFSLYIVPSHFGFLFAPTYNFLLLENLVIKQTIAKRYLDLEAQVEEEEVEVVQSEDEMGKPLL